MIKLYKNFTRFGALKQIPAAERKYFLWGRSLRPGDIVHNCSGFNGIVKSLTPEYGTPCWFRKDGTEYTRRRARVLCDIDIEFQDSSRCSLIHCVSPAVSKEAIIKYWKHWSEQGYHLAKQWPNILAIIEKYRSGVPICDERGLPT